MKVISPANETVMKILKNFQKPGTKYRKLKYLVDAEVEEGVLLFNLFTRELVLLDKEEFGNAIENEYLRNQWFIVPEECDEKEYVKTIRYMLQLRSNPQNTITNYTIFTTTNCNARCYYCFEAGQKVKTMSVETASKVAEYIISHSNKEKVILHWFGGEPLLNLTAIDTICNRLIQAGIEYDSRMTTNGYLITDSVIEKAITTWKLNHVQITLDGTEEIYNKIKSYINTLGSPYLTVINNINLLLNNNISTTIRLNVDLNNAEDLLVLCEELATRFRDNKKLSVYAHHLFSEKISMAEMYTPEEWQERDYAMLQIENKLEKYGLILRSSISKKLKINHCKADADNAITILPEGQIGVCDMHTDSEYIGNIDNKDFHQEVITKWKTVSPEIKECNECYYYPECIKLKNCTNERDCYPIHRAQNIRTLKRNIKYCYYKNLDNNP